MVLYERWGGSWLEFEVVCRAFEKVDSFVIVKQSQAVAFLSWVYLQLPRFM